MLKASIDGRFCTSEIDVRNEHVPQVNTFKSLTLVFHPMFIPRCSLCFNLSISIDFSKGLLFRKTIVFRSNHRLAMTLSKFLQKILIKPQGQQRKMYTCLPRTVIILGVRSKIKNNNNSIVKVIVTS